MQPCSQLLKKLRDTGGRPLQNSRQKEPWRGCLEIHLDLVRHVFERRSPGAHSLTEQEDALTQGKPLHSADGAASCPAEDSEPRGVEEEQEVLRLVERSTFISYEPVAPRLLALQRSRSEPALLSACENGEDAGQEPQEPQKPQEPEPQPAQPAQPDPGKAFEHIHAYLPCHPTDSPFEPPAYGELPAWAWERRAVRRRTPRFKLLNAVRQANGEIKWVPFP